MNGFWIGLILGLIVGFVCGLVVMSALAMSKIADEREIYQRRLQDTVDRNEY